VTSDKLDKLRNLATEHAQNQPNLLELRAASVRRASLRANKDLPIWTKAIEVQIGTRNSAPWLTLYWNANDYLSSHSHPELRYLGNEDTINFLRPYADELARLLGRPFQVDFRIERTENVNDPHYPRRLEFVVSWANKPYYTV
jgi:hypothetical protein